MPFIAYSSLLLFLFLQACNLDPDSQASAPNPDSLENARTSDLVRDDTGLFHTVRDDRTAGGVKPQAYTYSDPVSGTTYQVNPNWGVVQRRPKTSAEASLPGTNGLLQTYVDWSGRVETRIYECVSPTKVALQNSIGCQVEQGFILIGGGAWANYGSGAGAFIWESRPLDVTLTTWVGSSKDHVKSCPHYLHVYAIGMRLKDDFGNYVPKQSLLGSVIKLVTRVTYPAAQQNRDAIAVVDWGMGNDNPTIGTNLGGGARANWNSKGAFLTEVGAGKVHDGGSCVAMSRSKDHYATEFHTLTTYAISMKPDGSYSRNSVYIPNFGKLHLTSKRELGSAVTTGVSVALMDADPGFVITSLGGQSDSYSAPGRLLIGVKPTGTYSGQVGVYAKDHKVVVPGHSAVFFSQVRKLP